MNVELIFWIICSSYLLSEGESHYHVNRSVTFCHFLRLLNPVHTFAFFLSEICLNIILTYIWVCEVAKGFVPSSTLNKLKGENCVFWGCETLLPSLL
jgi:hypothetical protein